MANTHNDLKKIKSDLVRNFDNVNKMVPLCSRLDDSEITYVGRLQIIFINKTTLMLLICEVSLLKSMLSSLM